jgi:hypothetical protein
MDKTQKQLLDTYIRKRIIANDFDYNDITEVTYLLNNNYKIILNQFSYLNIVHLLIKHPEFITKLNYRDIKKLDDVDYIESIFYLLSKDKIDYILKNIDYNILSNDTIKDIIIRFPNYIENINITKLTGNYIGTILGYHPDLIKYFDLDKLTNYNIRNLLVLQPQLKHYFLSIYS